MFGGKLRKYLGSNLEYRAPYNLNPKLHHSKFSSLWTLSTAWAKDLADA